MRGYHTAPDTRGKLLVRRLFHSFPGGLPGVALLLLRAVLGIVLIHEGSPCFAPAGLSAEAWFITAALLSSGILLAAGLLTPFAAGAAILLVMTVARGLFPSFAFSLLGAAVSVLFAETMLVAILLQGPGAVSIDARIFGRREIIIPLPGDGVEQIPYPAADTEMAADRVNGAAELREVHPLCLSIEADTDAFHQVGQDDLLPERIERAAADRVAPRRIATIGPIEVVALKVEFQIDRLRQAMASGLSAHPSSRGAAVRVRG